MFLKISIDKTGINKKISPNPLKWEFEFDLKLFYT